MNISWWTLDIEPKFLMIRLSVWHTRLMCGMSFVLERQPGDHLS